MQAEPLLDDAQPTLVLYGDVPLIRPSTLRRLFATSGDVALLTVQLAQPAGYGRIVRDWHGNVLRIVEERDANDDERKLTEVNTGILMAPTAKLKRWLKALSNENAQREYYLPDVIAQAVAEHCRVIAVECADPDETRGVNSKEQLATIERIAQRRIAGELMERGVTLTDPARIDVRGNVSAGTDVSIDVGCVFEGTGRSCRRRAHRRLLRNPQLFDRRRHRGVAVFLSRWRDDRRGCAHRPVRTPAPRRDAGRRSSHRQLRRGQGQHAGPRLQSEPSGVRR